MPDLDLAVMGGTVVTDRGRARLNVYAADGRVAHVGPETLAATDVVDASGLFVLPGMVDSHVHLMDPGPTDREDFPTGTSAAAASGVTTIVEHTHGHPVREVADFTEKAEYLRDRSWVDFGLAAHAWPDRVDRIPELWRAGVVFFKIFTCDTHGLPGFSPADVLSAFRTLARAGAPCLVHCEDDSITAAAERALRESGRDDGAVLPEWRNREAELVATAATSILARATGTRATIAHVSHPGAAELITDQRRRGGDLAAEACPQYFLLREHEALDHGAFRKFTPPARARSDEDEEEMWRLLREGVLTHVSTDHAPATREQKTNGDIWSVHFGLPGLDSTFRLLLDAALTGRLSLEDVVRVYATNPARRYGLWPRKGALEPGADADLVLVDPAATGVLRDEDVISKAGWTPYAGRAVRGAPVRTYLRGRLVSEERKVAGGPEGRHLLGPGSRGGA